MSTANRVDVEGVLDLPGRDDVLSLRNYYGVTPGEPNLCLTDASGNVRWNAQQRHPLDKWVHVRLEDGRLFATSWEGWRCELDVENGQIVSSEFVK